MKQYPHAVRGHNVRVDVQGVCDDVLVRFCDDLSWVLFSRFELEVRIERVQVSLVPQPRRVSPPSATPCRHPVRPLDPALQG